MPSISPRRLPRAPAIAARIFPGPQGHGIHHDGSRVSGVQTDRGRIAADYVVLCGGMWTAIWPLRSGDRAPHACEHY